MHFIIPKMIATIGFLIVPECTKFVFGRDFAPDPVCVCVWGGGLQHYPRTLAGLMWPTSSPKGRGGERNEREMGGKELK